MSEKSTIADIFTCDNCDGHRIEEVRVEGVVMTEVVAIDCIGRADWGEVNHWSGGRVDCYRCVSCGKTIGRNELLALVKLHDKLNQADCTDSASAADSHDSTAPWG